MIDKNREGKPLTKPERAAAAALIRNLFELQKGLKEDWLRHSLPEGWQGLEVVEPKKTRVTLNLDADMVKHFRALGPGYQRVINQILRVYLNGIASGKVRVRPELADMGPNYLAPLMDVLVTSTLVDVEGAPRLQDFLTDWVEVEKG